jgi:hypothetical protein
MSPEPRAKVIGGVWRVVGPALVLGVIGALIGSKSAVVHIPVVAIGGLAGIACGLIVGASTYRRTRTTARGVYLIVGSVVTWLILALVLPTLVGGSIGLDESFVRLFAIAATVCCLVGCIAGIISLRKREE